jgi:hypothetical protein
MNPAGMTFLLTGVSANLSLPLFQALVTNGHIRQDELDGTRKALTAIISTLKNTPAEKIEAMVSEFNEELTQRIEKYNAEWGKDSLGAFRDAQIVVGQVTTIMAKSGVK